MGSVQMHVGLSGPPTPHDLAAVMQQLASLGLQLHVTEMDVRIPVDASGHASWTDQRPRRLVTKRFSPRV